MRQLNIKNEETYRLVKKLSRLTGENVTQAVTRAVEERLEKLKAKAKDGRKGIAEKLLAIGKECAALPTLDGRAPDDILYDKNGLPKA